MVLPVPANLPVPVKEMGERLPMRGAHVQIGGVGRQAQRRFFGAEVRSVHCAISTTQSILNQPTHVHTLGCVMAQCQDLANGQEAALERLRSRWHFPFEL